MLGLSFVVSAAERPALFMNLRPTLTGYIKVL